VGEDRPSVGAGAECRDVVVACVGDPGASRRIRKLFRLVQLEEVAERIVQEGLAPSARGEWD
jgi:hypothetical protein